MDTICALATAPGGALGIIRISGEHSLEILSRIFTKDLTDARPNTIHYGHILAPECDAVLPHHTEVIDEVLVSVFRAPHSYTGEDSAEISCHGSRYILKKVLELLVQNGCRIAHPGEYTMRAYLNGKMDLSQAEAVADLIASTNQATHQMAMSQLRGGISSELSRLREHLLKLTSLSNSTSPTTKTLSLLTGKSSKVLRIKSTNTSLSWHTPLRLDKPSSRAFQ